MKRLTSLDAKKSAIVGHSSNSVTFDEANNPLAAGIDYPSINLRGWNETSEYLDALHLVQDLRRRMDEIVRHALNNGYRINLSGNITIDRVNVRK